MKEKMSWVNSPTYNKIVTAQMYYHNLSAIKDKRLVTKVGSESGRSDCRMRSGLFGHVVNQRRDYVLAHPYACEHKQIKRQFSMYELRRAATDYVCCGVMVVGLDAEGKFKRYPPESVDFDGNWVGVDAITPTLKLDDGTGKCVEAIRTTDVPKPSFYTRLENDEPSLFDSIREYIDAYELLWSRKQDALADAPNAPIRLKGYLDDPDTLITRMREDNIVCLDSDGECDQMVVRTDFDQADNQLTQLHEAIYDIGCVVDMAKAVIGNTSSVALRLLYVDLENKSAQLCDTLEEAIRRCLRENSLGLSDDEIENLHIEWAVNTIVNENDAIINCSQAQNLVSTQTMLENMPWVTDVQEEMKRLAAEAIFADESSIDSTQGIRLASRAQIASHQQRNNREDVSKTIQKYVRSDFAKDTPQSSASGKRYHSAGGNLDNSHT